MLKKEQQSEFRDDLFYIVRAELVKTLAERFSLLRGGSEPLSSKKRQVNPKTTLGQSNHANGVFG